MERTNIEQFANFAADVDLGDLPGEVVEEAKRIVLDSLGCALAAAEVPSGRAGIEYGHILGGAENVATIVGVRERVSAHGAAFANAELMNALDFDAVAAPGHVAPYVVPVALALGEKYARAGGDVITAVAVCHEMSYRFSKAMDRNRDVRNGKANPAPVLGYASTVFGVTAAAAIMKRMGSDAIADALGIAGSTSPVNGHRAWLMHAPASTIKNSLMPGGVAMTAMTAAYMAALGHRGDKALLDDAEFGYPRFIGTRRWEPAALTTDLGTDWRFPTESHFKPYPHCRVSHALFDALIELVTQNKLVPDEIESLAVWGEEWAGELPTFTTRVIERPFDAQFSFIHGLALAAHLIPPGRAWQDPEVVYSPSVLALMSRIVWRPHPDWAAAVSHDPAARPSRVEISARGETFIAERRYPKGTPSRDPSTYMTTDELIAKFLQNAADVISPTAAEEVVDGVLHLEALEDVRTIMQGVRRT